MCSDIWAIGVITYFLLCGYTPFDRESKLDEMQAILDADYSFTPLHSWRSVSPTAKDFISKCLTVPPEQRLTAGAALNHPWLSGIAHATEDLLPTVKTNFNAKRKFHAAIDTVRAINQLRANGAAAAANGALNNGASSASGNEDVAGTTVQANGQTQELNGK